jgi:hypothetical protein
MTTALKPELETLPERLRNLPVDERGYPVPWFVAWHDGKPEFRAMDAQKFRDAVKQRRCWVCGQPLGRWLAFPIGAMCVITRTIAEPPSHRECAEWSIRNCPFLSNPRAVRDHTNIPADAREAAGVGIQRNPGVCCLWMTREYETFRDGRGGVLLTIGKPTTQLASRRRREKDSRSGGMFESHKEDAPTKGVSVLSRPQTRSGYHDRSRRHGARRDSSQ